MLERTLNSFRARAIRSTLDDHNADSSGSSAGGYNTSSTTLLSPLRPGIRRFREEPSSPGRPTRPNPAATMTRNSERDIVNQITHRYNFNQEHSDLLLFLISLDAKIILLYIVAMIIHYCERTNEERVDYTKVEWYKKTVVPKLKAVMMSFKLQAYVTGLRVYLITDMTENPSLWGVPEDIFADPRKLAALSSAVSQTLTEWRSKTKLKIQASIAGKENIYTLTAKIAGQGFPLKEEHYERISLLRMVYVRSLQPEEEDVNTSTFSSSYLLSPRSSLPLPPPPSPSPSPSPLPSHLPDSFGLMEGDTDRSGVGGAARGEMASGLPLKHNFWKSVDYALISSCAPVNDASTTTEKVTKELFKAFLRSDLEMYPLNPKDRKPKNNKTMSRWQRDMERVIDGFVCTNLRENDSDSEEEN